MTAGVDWPAGADPLARRARTTPDRVALVDAADGQAWRYAALDGDVDEMAGHLAGLGLGTGDHLGVLLETSLPAVRLLHAGWRLGCRVVPLNARLAEAELARQAERADVDALVAGEPLAATAARIFDGPVATVGSPDAHGVQRLSTIESASVQRADWRPDDPALALFTSGTTGAPKAVTLTMGNLQASATASAFRLGVTPADRWLLCLPVYHMGGLAPVLRTAIYGTALVVRSFADGFEAATVARDTGAHDVTGLSLVPTQLHRLLDVADEAPLADTVRTVLLGGAPARPALLARARDRGVPVYPTYGLTETASQATTATPAQAAACEGTVGQPLYGTEVTIVDGSLDPLPAGESGEIVVAGPTVTPGYYADQEATEAAFCQHGLRTGDVGHVDGVGRLWVTGRLDDAIVTGGETVQPAAVVRALEAHPGVAAAAVVGLADPEWGERVAALVVRAEGVTVSADGLRAHCRERVADFAVPRTLAFADTLPRTASGTVDRTAVRDRLTE